MIFFNFYKNDEIMQNLLNGSEILDTGEITCLLNNAYKK